MLFEGNFYPVASGVFIEDDNYRLTVLTGQATGATLYNKSLDIMVDRRLSGDDGKGLGRGDASDVSSSTFFLTFLLTFAFRFSLSPVPYDMIYFLKGKFDKIIKIIKIQFSIPQHPISHYKIYYISQKYLL